MRYLTNQGADIQFTAKLPVGVNYTRRIIGNQFQIQKPSSSGR